MFYRVLLGFCLLRGLFGGAVFWDDFLVFFYGIFCTF